MTCTYTEGLIRIPLELISDKDFAYNIDVNVGQAYRLTKTFLPLLRQRKGRVLNMSSCGAWNYLPGFGAYHIGKAGLTALTYVWRKELAKSGVAVYDIEPGMIHTAAWDKALSSANSDAKSGFQSFSKDPPYTNAPDALQRYYKPLIDQCTTYAQIAKGSSIPPDHVANAVLHALTSRFPRNRYLVGVDAWSADFAKRVMSDFVTDVMGFWSW